MTDILNAVFNSKVINALGWTIIDSLFLGFIIFCTLSLILKFIDKDNSAVRYWLSYFALLFLFLITIKIFNENYSRLDFHAIKQFGQYLLIEQKNINNPLPGLIPESKFRYMLSIINETNLFINTNIRWLVLFWLGGLGFSILKSLSAVGHIKKLSYSSNLIDNPHLNKLVKYLQIKSKLSTKISAFESNLINVPSVIGFIKPVILIPVGFMNNLPAEQVEIILAHEFGHIKNIDHILKPIQVFIKTILFHNPFVYLIAGYIDKEREHLCDDFAMTLCSERIPLAKALVNLAELKFVLTDNLLSIKGSSQSSIYYRIKRILQKENLHNTRNMFVHSLLSIVALFILGTTFIEEYFSFDQKYRRNTAVAVNESNSSIVNLSDISKVLKSLREKSINMKDFKTEPRTSFSNSQNNRVFDKNQLADLARLKNSNPSNIIFSERNASASNSRDHFFDMIRTELLNSDNDNKFYRTNLSLEEIELNIQKLEQQMDFLETLMN